MPKIETVFNSFEKISPNKSDKIKSEANDYGYQYALGIKEASQFFNIGEHTLRKLIKQDTKGRFSFHVGNRARIKRSAFEQYLDECAAV